MAGTPSRGGAAVHSLAPIAWPAQRAPTRAEWRQQAHAPAATVHLHVGRVVLEGALPETASRSQAGISAALGSALAAAVAGSGTQSGHGSPQLQGLAEALLPHLHRAMSQAQEP